jgi:hypothetical protein
VALSPLLLAIALTFTAPQPESLAVVAVDGCDQGLVGAQARTIREALTRAMGAAVQTEERTVRPLAGSVHGAMAEGERLLAGAWQDWGTNQWDRAERALRVAIEIFWGQPPTDVRWRNLRDAYALLALLQHKQGKVDEAELTIQRVLRVEPEFPVATRNYPPTFVAFVDSQRDYLKLTRLAALTVSTRPPGLPVYVGGAPIGNSPTTAKLVPGEYIVEAGFAGPRGARRLVRVVKAEAAELDEGFEGAIAADAGPCFATDGRREARLAGLVRLAALVGATSIVAVRVEELSAGERYLTASLVDAQAGQEVREAKVRLVAGAPPPGGLDRRLAFVQTGVAEWPVEAVSGALAVRKPPESVSPPSLNWRRAGLGGIALGVALGGVATYLAITSAQRHAQIVAMETSAGVVPAERVPEATRLDAEGAGQARASGILGVAAGVVAAAGVGVLILPAPQTGGGGVVISLQARL